MNGRQLNWFFQGQAIVTFYNFESFLFPSFSTKFSCQRGNNYDNTAKTRHLTAVNTVPCMARPDSLQNSRLRWNGHILPPRPLSFLCQQLGHDALKGQMNMFNKQRHCIVHLEYTTLYCYSRYIKQQSLILRMKNSYYENKIINIILTFSGVYILHFTFNMG